MSSVVILTVGALLAATSVEFADDISGDDRQLRGFGGCWLAVEERHDTKPAALFRW
ncbi:hypothetical protein ACLB1N_16815 [Escherichia coli]